MLNNTKSLKNAILNLLTRQQTTGECGKGAVELKLSNISICNFHVCDCGEEVISEQTETVVVVAVSFLCV